MILKNNLTKFDLSVKSSQSNLGLSDGDYWCFVHIFFDNSDAHFDLSGEILAKSELNELLFKLKEFLHKRVVRERISFIKNYFLFYLDASKKNMKKLVIKFIHIDEKKANYFLTFYDDEIVSFVQLLESYQKEFYC